MQQIRFIEKNNIEKINFMLSDGWRVISITPVFEPIATGGSYSCRGDYGAYIVLEKEND